MVSIHRKIFQEPATTLSTQSITAAKIAISVQTGVSTLPPTLKYIIFSLPPSVNDVLPTRNEPDGSVIPPGSVSGAAYDDRASGESGAKYDDRRSGACHQGWLGRFLPALKSP